LRPKPRRQARVGTPIKEQAHMIRKFAAALTALAIAVGSVFAEEIRGTFVKFADGTLTLKVDDKDKDYKIPSDLKIKRKNFKTGEEEEVKAIDSLEKINNGKFKPTVLLTVDGDKVTGVKYEFKGFGKGKGKGKDKDKDK
jgi:hypothetical protein